jgi:4'-phosphopantetheinyl transferase EntD
MAASGRPCGETSPAPPAPPRPARSGAEEGEPPAGATAARARAAAAALARLLPPEARVAGVAIGAPVAGEDALFPEERAAILRAVPRRRAELAAGRAAARAAMAMLGRPPAPVPAGADRAPVWPAGLSGSIAHSDGVALAALAPAGAAAALGIDIEPDEGLEDALADEIATPAERARLAALPGPARGRALRALFAAKEAAYKAQYPLSRALLGFEAIAIEPGPAGRFAARFAAPAPPFAAGDRIAGRLGRAAGLVLAAAALPPAS